MSDRERHFRTERLDAGRCPACGSSEWSFTDYSSEYRSEYWGQCRSCGFAHDFETDAPTLPPFILPGDPGSHDRIDEYDPESEDT